VFRIQSGCVGPARGTWPDNGFVSPEGGWWILN
jgi:hypothetical protein